ncbi:MAG: gene transfer agent family protein [Hyphomicrobiales bacterium]
MANKHRGEISAELGGRVRSLCLTLGALAELEAALGDEDMLALATRFEAGRLRAADAIAILGAGLRGAGEDISDVEVATLQVNGGAAGYVGIVADLLAATFSPVDVGDADSESKKKSSATGQGHPD